MTHRVKNIVVNSISGSGRLEEKVNDFFSTRGDLKDAIVSLTQGETMLERLQGLVEDIEDYTRL